MTDFNSKRERKQAIRSMPGLPQVARFTADTDEDADQSPSEIIQEIAEGRGKTVEGDQGHG